MPFYEYRCNDCGTEFEMLMRFSEADRRPECPSCESPKTSEKAVNRCGLRIGSLGIGQK